jgi:tRNA1(Val) A37 N6-methylase TrmN6
VSRDFDRFLNGRVRARQPARGFRSGLDAVMVAAAVPARDHDSVLEMGAGAGIASLCLAARVSGSMITGVEIDPALVRLASVNAKANGVQERVSFVEGDALALRLRREFDHAFANPPFHDEERASPRADRARARHNQNSLADWARAALRRVRSKGTMTLIVRADRLAELLDPGDRRGIAVFPLWPGKGKPAKRVIVQMRKGSAAPFLLLPGLTLHESNGNFTRDAHAVLRQGASLDLSGRAC